MHNGSVKSLWRYPVKSLLGEKLDCLEINHRGVVNDRIYAITNEQGKLGSGKNTRRFKRIDDLFSIQARMNSEEVSIIFPDGIVLTNKSRELNEKLTETLGQKVRLTQESEISHFDDSAIHILTSSSLSMLKDLLPQSGIDERRFRANIVIDTALHMTDDELVGKIIEIGEVKLKITHKSERCRMITLRQDSLGNAPEILKKVSKNFGLNFGVYASVVNTGSISMGDRVEILNK